MATTHSITYGHGEHTVAAQRCQCGCTGCQGQCCDLGCLVRPNFFSGQLLTDEDLQTLTAWVRDRASLVRYRDGWGVACGLEVRLQHEARSRVTVTPGYAIDCCGRDLVVCRDLTLDFEPLTKPDEDPCQDLRPPGASASVLRGRIYDDDEEKPPLTGAGPADLPLNELLGFNLYLRYAEDLSGAQRALVQGRCEPTDPCQYTRVLEAPELVAKPAALCSARESAEAHNWESAFLKGRDKIVADVSTLTTAAAFLDYLRRRPEGLLYTFGFVEEWLSEAAIFVTEHLPQLRFWIVQDWINHYLHCGCSGCATTDGVLLARVWVRRRPAPDPGPCRVVYIDPFPPHRRPLRPMCPPVMPDYIGVASYIWQPLTEVCASLATLGYPVVQKKELTITTATWQQALVRELFVPCQVAANPVITAPPTLTVFVVEDPCGRPRVVRIQGSEPHA
jgi:hypothetical protein